MRTRGNRGIIGPQTLVNTSGGSGVNSLHDEQQLASALSWPGFFPPPPTVGYLVVAGGGGGGSLMGGGGGAGGFRSSAGYSFVFTGGANYLEGTSDLSLAGDLTIEYWYNAPGTGVILNIGSEGSNRMQIQPGYIEWFGSGYGGAFTWTAAAGNAWNHIAIVRSGTTFAVYQNGVSQGTRTISGTLGNSGHWYVGTRSDGNVSSYTGKIGDLRILRGTALYSSTFTPPTEPLTAIANTIFLLSSNSSTKVDASNNNYTITTTGTVTKTRQAPTILNDFSVTSGSSITVTVGSGGSGSNNSGSFSPPKGSNGTNSVFSTITSAGGGGGGSNDSSPSSTITPGWSGGSGGGGAGSAQSPNRSGGSGDTPSITPAQGNSGGTGSNASPADGGGGGGGAGASGGSGSGSVGGDGGIGSASFISGSSTTYAGGGGGGTYNSNGTAGAGGSGGGGAGTNNSTTATSGTTNTGGGGGGNGGRNTGGYKGGDGGSGVVIIRYLNTYANAVITTGSPTYSNTGGYKIYTFTGSGSITF